jgi:hypothetical protein
VLRAALLLVFPAASSNRERFLHVAAAAWDDYVTALLEWVQAHPPTAVWPAARIRRRLPDWSRTGIDNEIRRMHAQVSAH